MHRQKTESDRAMRGPPWECFDNNLIAERKQSTSLMHPQPFSTSRGTRTILQLACHTSRGSILVCLGKAEWGWWLWAFLTFGLPWQATEQHEAACGHTSPHTGAAEPHSAGGTEDCLWPSQAGWCYGGRCVSLACSTAPGSRAVEQCTGGG